MADNAFKVIREQLPKFLQEDQAEGFRGVLDMVIPSDLSEAALTVAGGPVGKAAKLGALALAGASYSPEAEAGKVNQLSGLARYLDQLDPELFSKGRLPEQLSKTAQNIITKLKTWSPTGELSSSQQRNIAAQVDDLGLSILGRRGFANTDADNLIAPRMTAYGGDHVDINPRFSISKAFSRNGVDVPVLLGGKGIGSQGYRIESQHPALRGYDFAIYPNTIDGLTAFAAEKVFPNSRNYAITYPLKNNVLVNPSAVVLNPEKIRFALEAQGKPGIGYRKKKGGLIQMKERKCHG